MYGDGFSKKDIVTIGLSLIIMFTALLLYHPVTNLGIVVSNPEKPGPLVAASNLEIIVDSQFFTLNGSIIKVNSNALRGYAIIFSSMGLEVKRTTLQMYGDKLRSTFNLQPDRYTIRVILQFMPLTILNLYDIKKITNGAYTLLIVSNDTFNIIKDITVLMNSSSSVTIHMTINIAETSILRTEIFDYYTNGNIDKRYIVRLIYNYNSYGELYKDILFLISSSSIQAPAYGLELIKTVTVLSNADEKITVDGKAYFDDFVVDLKTNITPLFFVQGVIRIAWYIEVRS